MKIMKKIKKKVCGLIGHKWVLYYISEPSSIFAVIPSGVEEYKCSLCGDIKRIHF